MEKKIERALVLGGGSIRGAFQAGAIAEVLDQGFEPDAIYCTSVGALNGGILADRAGRAVKANQSIDWKKIGNYLEGFWRNNVTSFKVIGRKRNELGLGIQIFLNRFDGQIDTTPLKNLVKQLIITENLKNSPAKFVACAVSVTSGLPVYRDQNDPYIWDHIIASTAIPLVMPISWVKGEPFLDGGIREVAPLNKACDDRAEHIVCILCQPEKETVSEIKTRELMILIERIMDIVTNELVNNDLKVFDDTNAMLRKYGSQSKGPLAGKRVIPKVVIRPTKTINLNLEKFTSKQIKDVIDEGRRRAKDELKTPPPWWP